MFASSVSSGRGRVGVASLIPCLWGKLQNLSLSKVSKQVVMSFCVAGVALCDTPTCLITCQKCQNWRKSRTKCSFCCAHVSRLESLVFLWRRHVYGGSCKTSPCRRFPSRLLYTLHSTLYILHSTLYTLHSTLYSLHSTLRTLHSTLYTLHSTLCTPHFTFYTPHFTLYTPHSTLHALHSTLHTLHFTLSTPRSTLYTPHTALYTLHFTLHTLHFALHTPHSTLYTLHSTLHTLHSTLYTLHSTLCTPHFTFYTPHFRKIPENPRRHPIQVVLPEKQNDYKTILTLEGSTISHQ